MTKPASVAAAVLRVGEPDVAGPLAVHPVFGPAPVLEYRSFAEAAALGASVRELPQPDVNALLVDNPLDVPLLLYEGEQVQGAQQDRVLDVSVLVGARSRVQVPVSCVEAGRWDGRRRGEAFTPGPQAAFPELRRAKARAASQAQMWDTVAAKADRFDAQAPTGAMRDVFAARADDVEALRAVVSRRDGQIGAVAVIAGTICVADVVGRADVFAALHAPLVAGYALDASEHAATADALAEPPVPPMPLAAVQTFLDAALTEATVTRPALGLGAHRRFAGAHAEGSRLDHAGELVALTAFPAEHPTAVHVSRPSRRR